jgi:ribonuclease BN (tRNA processing enzyme)
MKLTVVGCGDAFNSGGRGHSCFRLDTAKDTVLVDFGGSSLANWKSLGFCTDDISAIIVSHLHGDHFGGIPFLLLECQFAAHRVRPLVFVGPRGFRTRLEMAMESLYWGSTAIQWQFPWKVIEIEPGQPIRVCGLEVMTMEVIHPSGAPATSIRISDGERVFAYSGDTAWTEALVETAAGADLFLVECSSPDQPIPNHIDWPTLKAHLPSLRAKRTLVTHIGDHASDLEPAMEAAGLTIAHDGLIIDL